MGVYLAGVVFWWRGGSFQKMVAFSGHILKKRLKLKNLQQLTIELGNVSESVNRIVSMFTSKLPEIELMTSMLMSEKLWKTSSWAAEFITIFHPPANDHISHPQPAVLSRRWFSELPSRLVGPLDEPVSLEITGYISSQGGYPAIARLRKWWRSR